MNIRQAIFASVASAGVLAAGWVGGTPPVAQATPTPAPYRLGSAASGSSAATATRLAAAPSTLSSVRRQQLRGSEPVQLISTPGPPVADGDRA
ncbi:hypothetical protein ACTXOR_12775 [Arthrobacter rhombi]|uniref:hypothetical protein n=1 Tax=Arthrobacter rhombi TaxID=71253 RepID=UPI003FD0A3AD